MNDFEIFQKKQFLIEELHRFVEEFEFVPYSYMMNPKYGYPAAGTYQYYFGTFNNVLEEAGLKINKIGKLNGTEICTNCDKRAVEIQGFIQWHYNKSDDNKRYCNRCGNDKGIYHHKKGTLDINSGPGRGRAGEITVIKTLKIGDEHDCARLSCGYPFDMYNDEFGKINVKTSVLNGLWQFNFVAQKIADTYICLGMSSDIKQVERVWVVSNESNIKNLTKFTIYNTYVSLRNHEKWEVNTKIYNEAWKEMLLNYTDGKCKIFNKKGGIKLKEMLMM